MAANIVKNDRYEGARKGTPLCHMMISPQQIFMKIVFKIGGQMT